MQINHIYIICLFDCNFFSLVTTASSNSLVEYIQRLENEIIELKEARARDQEEQARD